MGVLNVTPNSFSAVGRHLSLDLAIEYARQMHADGAAIIDVGGEPTNPGVNPIVSLQEELDRVIPVVEILAKELPIPISVDTSKPEVMRTAIEKGARFINDVRGLSDPGAMKVVADSGVGVCLMHMLHPYGKPTEVENDALGDDPITSIKAYLQKRVEECLAAGIKREQIVIDPGVGHGNFGKNLQQNIALLAGLEEFLSLGFPILIGLSRKTFIGEILNLPVEDRLYGSLAAAVIAVTKGASIIRTHDVRPTFEAVKVANALSPGLFIKQVEP